MNSIWWDKRRHIGALASAILGLLTFGHAGNASAATATVTNCSDSGPGSLRSAVAGAASGDTIDLRALTCPIITLVNGPVAIGQANLTLVGPGHALTVSGNHSSSVFRHSGRGVLRIERLAIAYGLEQGTPTSAALGGCIYSASRVELDHVKVHGCSALSNVPFGDALGGGIYARNVLLRHSVVNSNLVLGGESHGSAAGGGVVANNLWVDHSTISLNRSDRGDGGAFVYTSLHMLYASIVYNHAPYAGAFQVNHSAWIRHSTIAGNYAKYGGIAVFPGWGPLVVVDSTITNNSAGWASGLLITDPHYGAPAVVANNTIAFNYERTQDLSTCNGALKWYATIHLQSTIVSNNTCGGVPVDINVSYVSDLIDGDNNLVMVGNAFVLFPGTIISADPKLGPLARNGGPTMTRALMSGSPAIDLGNDFTGLHYDERGPGFPRVKGVSADIGAFER